MSQQLTGKFTVIRATGFRLTGSADDGADDGSFTCFFTALLLPIPSPTFPPFDGVPAYGSRLEQRGFYWISYVGA
jgi:hypothetical protein